MQLTIPTITRAIKLTDFAPELVNEKGEPVTVYVWVNPPASLLDTYQKARERFDELESQLKPEDPEGLHAFIEAVNEIGGVFADWYAAIWSKYPDTATHWTPDEVRTLAGDDGNGALYHWLRAETHTLIRRHRSGISPTLARAMALAFSQK